MLRDLGKWAAGRVAVVLNKTLGGRFDRSLGILTYHRITPDVRGVVKPEINVTPARFRSQLGGLLAGGFRFWPLSKVLDYQAAGQSIPPRTIVVTFDDGYESVYTNAWPVLRKLNIPATVFVSTGYLDGEDPFPFDPWATAQRDRVPAEAYRPLSTAQCREMAAGGLIEFGSHTHSHGDFRRRPDALRRDVQTSVDILRSRLGLREIPFAFPFGRWDLGFVSEELLAAARQTGVTCALSTEMVLNDPQGDPFAWGRFNVDAWDTASTLSAKLAGWYGWAPKLQQRLCRSNHEQKPAARATLPSGVYRGDHPATRLNRFKRGLAIKASSPLSAMLGRRLREAFGILAYHRIAQLPVAAPVPTWSVTPQRFGEQMQGLLRRGYQPWSLRKVLEQVRSGRPVPRTVFVITFDDGYANVYHHAWPVLRELGIPATIFLATAYLDSRRPFPFDDWSAAGSPRVAAESWRPLSTEQCAEMFDSGLVDLGTHTHTHQDFRGRQAAFHRDVSASLEVLRDRFGLAGATFSSPYGFADTAITATARRLGLLCNLRVGDDLVLPHHDPFAWGRLSIGQDDTPAMLAARLDGWYELARAGWQRLRRPFDLLLAAADRRPASNTHPRTHRAATGEVPNR